MSKEEEYLSKDKIQLKRMGHMQAWEELLIVCSIDRDKIQMHIILQQREID